MILSLAAAADSRTAAVNLSMLARTPSMSGRSFSNSSAEKRPGFGGITRSQSASRIRCSADAPTSFIVRAVIRTFQDMAAEFNDSRLMRKRRVALRLHADGSEHLDTAIGPRLGRRPAATRSNAQR